MFCSWQIFYVNAIKHSTAVHYVTPRRQPHLHLARCSHNQLVCHWPYLTYLRCLRLGIRNHWSLHSTGNFYSAVWKKILKHTRASCLEEGRSLSSETCFNSWLLCFLCFCCIYLYPRHCNYVLSSHHTLYAEGTGLPSKHCGLLKRLLCDSGTLALILHLTGFVRLTADLVLFDELADVFDRALFFTR
jgi:hypothetical protein